MSSLPAPANDFEFVVPEEDSQEEEPSTSTDDMVEDQADVDARKQQELIEQRKHSLRLAKCYFKLVNLLIRLHFYSSTLNLSSDILVHFYPLCLGKVVNHSSRF